MFLTTTLTRPVSYIMIQHAHTHAHTHLSRQLKNKCHEIIVTFIISKVFSYFYSILKILLITKKMEKHCVTERIKMRKCGRMWRTQRGSWTPRLQRDFLVSQNSSVSHVVKGGDVLSLEDAATPSQWETSSSEALPTHHHLPPSTPQVLNSKHVTSIRSQHAPRAW